MVGASPEVYSCTLSPMNTSPVQYGITTMSYAANGLSGWSRLKIPSPWLSIYSGTTRGTKVRFSEPHVKPDQHAPPP